MLWDVNLYLFVVFGLLVSENVQLGLVIIDEIVCEVLEQEKFCSKTCALIKGKNKWLVFTSHLKRRSVIKKKERKIYQKQKVWGCSIL